MRKYIPTLLFLFISQYLFAQTKTIIGFNEKNSEAQLSLESLFDKNLSTKSIEENMKILSSKPHHISSPGSKANAEYVMNQFKKFGWDAQIETFHVLFPTPKTRLGAFNLSNLFASSVAPIPGVKGSPG